MEQKITIKINEKDYTLKATSPEQEELIRKAARSVNKKIDAYKGKFANRQAVDILAFVALNESISALSFQKKLNSLSEEAASLKEATDSYLNNIM
ncbi:MAG: cell division protein ZapA [Bacteroidales bacterium]|nr:cell division protein ZapA [Bacteroidales bacterium]